MHSGTSCFMLISTSVHLADKFEETGEATQATAKIA